MAVKIAGTMIKARFWWLSTAYMMESVRGELVKGWRADVTLKPPFDGCYTRDERCHSMTVEIKTLKPV